MIVNGHSTIREERSHEDVTSNRARNCGADVWRDFEPDISRLGCRIWQLLEQDPGQMRSRPLPKPTADTERSVIAMKNQTGLS
jgi:hypothetical protein